MHRVLLGGATALGLLVCAIPPGTAQTPGGSRLVIVNMVERLPYGIAFAPIRITVQGGDTVRFVQMGHMPHNVEFKSAPAGADLKSLRAGPNLTAVGQTYDVVIDDRFPAGKYFYVCTPHEVLGMAGIIYVAL